MKKSVEILIETFKVEWVTLILIMFTFPILMP